MKMHKALMKIIISDLRPFKTQAVSLDLDGLTNNNTDICHHGVNHEEKSNEDSIITSIVNKYINR